MGTTSGNRSWLTGVMIGLAVTALGAVGLLSGWMDGLALASLDMHFRFSGERPADDRVLLIDIDDASLDAVGDWPWPRRRYAQLIRALSRAGATSIVLDVVLPEPSAPRVSHAGLSAQYDTDDVITLRGSRATEETVFDDDELRDAIAAAGNVYLAMFGQMAPGTHCPGALLDRCLAWLRDKPEMRLSDIRSRAAADATWAWGTVDDAVLVRALLVSELVRDFGLSRGAAATRLAHAGVEATAVEHGWRRAKEVAARRLALAFLSDEGGGADADRRWGAFLTTTLGPQAIDVVSSDRTALLEAFRWTRAYRAVKGFPVEAASEEADPCMPCVYDETLPLDKFARVARGVGFVAHLRDRGDGVVRSLPLLVRGRRRWYTQLGLACACDVLGFDRAELSAGVLRLSGDDATLDVPINAAGESVIAWHAGGAGGDWRTSFTHRAAASVLQAARAREAIEQNERRIGIAMGALLSLRCRETPSDYARYEALSNERWRLRRRQLRDAAALTPPQVHRLEQLGAQAAAMEQEALQWLRRLHGLWQGHTPESDAERAQRSAVEALFAELVEGALAARLAALNLASSEQAAAADAELRTLVAGKICLVGYRVVCGRLGDDAGVSKCAGCDGSRKRDQHAPHRAVHHGAAAGGAGAGDGRLGCVGVGRHVEACRCREPARASCARGRADGVWRVAFSRPGRALGDDSRRRGDG